MPYYYFDWTYVVLVLPCVLLSLWASANVNSTFRKYSQQYSSRRLTGAEAAQRVLSANGVYGVRIERISGNLTDHYDPRTNVIRLSDSVYDNTSTAAIGVACHEAGHAVQDELFRPQGNVPGNFRHLVHMLLGNNAFVRGETECPPVVLPHNMGSRHGQIDGHDIHVRMVLGHVPRIVNALDDLGSVFNLSSNHALARNLTHADDCHGRIWLHFAYDHASLACPYLKPYVNFCLSHENQGTINVLAPDSTLLSIIQESLREHTQKTRFSSARPRFKGL